MRLITLAVLSGILLLGGVQGFAQQSQTPPPPPPPPGDTMVPPPSDSQTQPQPPPPTSQPQPPLQPAPAPSQPPIDSQPGYKPPPPPSPGSSTSGSMAPGSNPASSTNSKVMYAAKNANVREKPDVSSSKVGMLKAGQQVNVTRSVNSEWVEIMYEDKPAYVAASLLTDKPMTMKPSSSIKSTAPTMVQPAAVTKAPEFKTMEANGSNGNRIWVYNSPDCTYRTTAFFVHEEKVQVVKKANKKFWEVMTREGKVGYVPENDLKPVGSGSVAKGLRDYCQEDN